MPNPHRLRAEREHGYCYQPKRQHISATSNEPVGLPPMFVTETACMNKSRTSKRLQIDCFRWQQSSVVCFGAEPLHDLSGIWLRLRMPSATEPGVPTCLHKQQVLHKPAFGCTTNGKIHKLAHTANRDYIRAHRPVELLFAVMVETLPAKALTASTMLIAPQAMCTN